MAWSVSRDAAGTSRPVAPAPRGLPAPRVDSARGGRQSRAMVPPSAAAALLLCVVVALGAGVRARRRSWATGTRAATAASTRTMLPTSTTNPDAPAPGRADADDVPDLPRCRWSRRTARRPSMMTATGWPTRAAPAPAGATQRCFERRFAVQRDVPDGDAVPAGPAAPGASAWARGCRRAARRCQFSETFSDTAVAARSTSCGRSTPRSMTQETATWATTSTASRR